MDQQHLGFNWSFILFTLLMLFYGFGIRNGQANSAKLNISRLPKQTRPISLNSTYLKDRQTSIRRQHSRNSIMVYNHDYGFENSYRRDDDTTSPYNQYHRVRGNVNVVFKNPVYLHYTRHIKNNYGYPHGDPQSMVILPNGILDVLFNVEHGDHRIDRILQYNIRNGRWLRNGPKFLGGHGQGLAYNYRSHQLWMVMNRYGHGHLTHGILPGSLVLSRINSKSLKPDGHRLRIRSKRNLLGENFTLDPSGNEYNVAVNYHKRHRLPMGSLKIYRGRGHWLKLIKDLKYSPGDVIQNIEYNPDTQRIYVVCNGCLISFPANKLNRLSSRDVNAVVFNHHSEFESLSFWHHRLYLLVHPNRILESNREF